MTKSSWLSLALAGVLLFSAGVLVGQQAQRSKFDKYLRATGVTQTQIAVLESNLRVVRAFMKFEVPEVYYDPRCACFSARATITGELANKPLDDLRAHPVALAETARGQLTLVVPEVSERDFKMEFIRLDLDHPNPPVTLAEYVNGKIVFK